ncbi:cytochrome P450 family protein [Actinomadura hibisca]|uniref:cytochrome P450 family protein n=1 Tax=Actinomadura hibisca TaxID=68565 RepID=UPI000833D854|nr:cytochrome P450 [Actinomadura hibisca]
MEPSSPTPLFSPEFFTDPHATFTWLRRHSPVHAFRFPYGDVPMWAVTRYQDVRDLLSDSRFSCAYSSASPEFQAAGLGIGRGTELEEALALSDPPRHTRLRRLTAKMFTSRQMEPWRGIVERTADRLIDELRERDEADLVADYAALVPCDVISAILGIPFERRRFVLDLTMTIFSADPSVAARAPEASAALIDYARQLLTDKRRRPGQDVTSELIAARQDGERLTETELIAMVTSFVIGGFDTTQNLIANAVLALLDHPDQRRLVLAVPDLPAGAVEEFIRYEGAFLTALWRFPGEDLEFAGTPLPAGAPVFPVVAAGNRDPDRFSHPDRLDLTRTDVRHVGFGHGLHLCLGAALARLEGQVAVPRLVRAFPEMTLAVPRAELTHRASFLVRALTSLPVRLGG